MTFTDILERTKSKIQKIKDEERQKSEQGNLWDNPIVKALGAGALGYATGGLASAALGMIPGMAGAAGAAGAGATGAGTAVAAGGAPGLPALIGGIESALKPTAGTILPALQAGMGALKGGEPVATGIEAGLNTGINTLVNQPGPEYKLKLAKMKTDVLKYAEPLYGTLEPGEGLPADAFEMEGVLPGVKYFRYRKQSNPIMQFFSGGGAE